ncbi:MAG: replication-associated recombination protein A [Candidatus Saccharimonadales bacterium]
MSTITPLAEQLRPQKIKDIIGQTKIVGKGEIIDHIITTKQPVSLILWGPPGSGKTTIARIIANEVQAECIELSAVTSGIADVKKVISHAEANRRLGLQTVLFVDEIHRFNKAQQDAFLPHVEKGTITLIGATTENPSFEVIAPLLSRMRVVVLEPLADADIIRIAKKALKILGYAHAVPKQAYQTLAHIAGGDARVALGTLELALSLSPTISMETIKQAAQTTMPSYDKAGEQHFAMVSAFIKSMRGSDVNATLYYLARMLQAGEDPKFIARRMIIFASEDVGVAASPALNLAVSTFLAVERIGMPECEHSLYHCATVLAGSKKSRAIPNAMGKAKQAAVATPNINVPLHLRNASTSLMKELGYGKSYQWEADYKHPDGFLPPEVKDLQVF